MPLTIIAAMSENRVIGVRGDLPWRLPADLRRFKALTTGHHIIMGRKTFESLPRPLPDRVNIVITRRADYRPEGAFVATDLDDALGLAAPDPDPFILGGGEIYALALPLCMRMEITLVHATVDGDTYFPEYNPREWELVQDERHEPDEKHAFAFSFQRLERNQAVGG